MVAIVGLIYAGQNQRLEDDEAVKAGTDWMPAASHKRSQNAGVV
jgi:hypothetical protein